MRDEDVRPNTCGECRYARSPGSLNPPGGSTWIVLCDQLHTLRDGEAAPPDACPLPRGGDDATRGVP